MESQTHTLTHTNTSAESLDTCRDDYSFGHECVCGCVCVGVTFSEWAISSITLAQWFNSMVSTLCLHGFVHLPPICRAVATRPDNNPERREIKTAPSGYFPAEIMQPASSENTVGFKENTGASALVAPTSLSLSLLSCPSSSSSSISSCLSLRLHSVVS